MNLGPVRLHVILGTLFAAWMFFPVAAAGTASWGYQALSGGNVNRALSLYSWSRALVPYNPFYHWTLGVIWSNQAKVSGDQQAAVRADQMFAQGFAADPSYLGNLIQRLQLHRDHRGLLPEPMTAGDLVTLAATLRETDTTLV